MNAFKRDTFLQCRIEDERGQITSKRAYLMNEVIACENGHEYVRDRFINKGMNGTVYQCHPSNAKEEVLAVKFLHVLTPQRIARFEFETLLLTQLDHPNVLNALDSGEYVSTLKEYPIPFLILELMEGNLHGLIDSKGTLPGNDVIGIGVQMCDAFTYIHDLGIIHRDVKPSNFLLKDRRVIVGDLGLAKTNTDEGRARFYREELTEDNELIGPQAFMSPELILYARNKNHPVGATSDLFQIGAVLWFALTGLPPLGIPNERDDPSGGKLFPVLAKCMSTSPDDRYQTAGELKDALQQL